MFCLGELAPELTCQKRLSSSPIQRQQARPRYFVLDINARKTKRLSDLTPYRWCRLRQVFDLPPPSGPGGMLVQATSFC